LLGRVTGGGRWFFRHRDPFSKVCAQLFRGDLRLSEESSKSQKAGEQLRAKL